MNPSAGVIRLLGEGLHSKIFKACVNGQIRAIKSRTVWHPTNAWRSQRYLTEQHTLLKLNPKSLVGSSWIPEDSPFKEIDSVRLGLEKDKENEETEVKTRKNKVKADAEPKVHPRQHICKLYETIVTPSEINLHLEFCGEQDLYENIKRVGIMNVYSAVWIARELLDAVEYCHSRNIIIRDIKCENMAIYREPGKQPILKLFDFECARDLDLPDDQNSFLPFIPFSPSTRMAHCVGTCNFMPPEMITNRDSTFKSDVYAFGCTLYQLLTGFAPFMARSEYLTWCRNLAREIDIPSYIDKNLLYIITRCLEHDPDERAEISELKLELDSYIAIRAHSSNHVEADPKNKTYTFYNKSMRPLLNVAKYFAKNLANSIPLRFETSDTLCECSKCNTEPPRINALKTREIPEDCAFFHSATILKKATNCNTLLIQYGKLQCVINEMPSLLLQLQVFTPGTTGWKDLFGSMGKTIVKHDDNIELISAISMLEAAKNSSEVIQLFETKPYSKELYETSLRFAHAALQIYHMKHYDEFYLSHLFNQLNVDNFRY